jgi:glutaredoxin-like protein NrdH
MGDMMSDWNHVEGRDFGDIRLYAISTCGHCRETREYLEGSGVSFEYLYVDLLGEDEMQEIYSEVLVFNPRGSFPTLVFENGEVIVGSRLDRIGEALRSNEKA